MSKYIPDEERDEIFRRLKSVRANQVCSPFFPSVFLMRSQPNNNA